MMINQPKTLFFTISSRSVFRNLIFFPGSVFELLKKELSKDKNLRIIFLVPADYYLRWQPILLRSGILGDRCLVESIQVSSPRNFLQKLFRFFYSYLVYTDTTRILATMGTRPDEPPAGGHRYLAPIKIFIARTLGRSRFVKNKLVPDLFCYFFPERPFADAFDKYKPTEVFVPHIYGWFDALLLAEARRRKIKTLGMPAGWDHVDKYFLPFKVDKFLVPSDQVKRAAIRYQFYNDKDIEVTGFPHFDLLVRKEYKMSRSDFLRRLNLPPDAKFILYISGSSYCPDEPDVIETILKWIDGGKFGDKIYLVIRPYSGGRGGDKDFDKEKFENFEKHPRVVFYRRESWMDLEKSIEYINIMRHAHAVISVYSTAFLEAAVLDRPLVAVAFDGYKKRPYYRSISRFLKFEHFQDVLKTGALKITNNFEELFGALDAYIKNPSLDSEKRRLACSDLCYKLDGRSSERIFESIMSFK